MANCTAPSNGHRTQSGIDNCPACRHRRYGGGVYSDYGSRAYSSLDIRRGSNSSGSSGNGGRRTTKPKWSRAGSAVFYTPAEVQTLTPYRETVENRQHTPEIDVRDVFLCHAWNDRQESAKELYDLWYRGKSRCGSARWIYA